MATKVCVKRVVIDYVAEGKPFTIEFTDPMKIGAIVFDDTDRQRLQAKQNDLAKDPTSGVPPVRELTFKKFGPFPELGGSGKITPREPQAEMDLSDEGPALWWHVNACTWFHPAKED
jgi:hypothetical protein